MDPPYNKGLIEPCLKGLADGGWLAEGALMIAETAVAETPDFSGWEQLSDRRIGAAKVWFLKQI
jgi:16S rRNA (guanine966-N2)-methyltransferase